MIVIEDVVIAGPSRGRGRWLSSTSAGSRARWPGQAQGPSGVPAIGQRHDRPGSAPMPQTQCQVRHCRCWLEENHCAGSGTMIVPLSSVTTSVLSQFEHRGIYVRLHFPIVSTRTGSAVEALRPGVDRMLLKAPAILLDAAGTHLPTRRRRLLAKTGKRDTCRRWLPFFIVGQNSVNQRKGARLLRASQDQAGLKLETEPGSIEVRVVDSAQKPSAN